MLFDDRNLRPGMMFADHELIGIPHRLVVSERGLKAGSLEFKSRTDKDSQAIEISNVENFLLSTITLSSPG